MIKTLISFIFWLIGAYIVLFASCVYVHVNESNIIANRANALLPKLSHQNKSGLVKVVEVQNLTRKSRPYFWQPYTLFKSLYENSQTDKELNRVLGKAIENLKNDLTGNILSNMDLREINFSHGKLEKADLTNANLANANLVSANLSNASLVGANLDQADLGNAILFRSDLKNSNLNGSNLKGANLSSGDFAGSILTNANFSKATLLEADFRKSNLRGANLKKANLVGAKVSFADLSESNLNNANFYDADLSNTILSGSDLNQADNVSCEQIQSAVIDKNTKLPDYIFLEDFSSSNSKCINILKGKGVNLKGIHLADFYFHQAYLQDANLSHSNLSQANLSHSNLSQANLSHSNLTGAHLEHANLKNTNLNKANLKGANLTQAYQVTCEQIQSAVIDKNTKLPDYIKLAGFPESTHECKSTLKGN